VGLSAPVQVLGAGRWWVLGVGCEVEGPSTMGASIVERPPARLDKLLASFRLAVVGSCSADRGSGAPLPLGLAVLQWIEATTPLEHPSGAD